MPIIRVRDYFRIFVHLVAAVQFSYAIYYDVTYVKFPESVAHMHNPFGGKFKYLTFLNAIIQALYYTLAVLNDLFSVNGLNGEKSFIRSAKDYVLASFAFPLAFNVGITFWTLYLIDRELVFPQSLDEIFPNWLNHIMHTNIMIFALLEMYVTFREYPLRKNGILGLTIFTLLYLIWIHIIKHISGYWVYPVLEVLQLQQRIIFFLALFFFTLSLYILGELINNIIWKNEKQISKNKSLAKRK